MNIKNLKKKVLYSVMTAVLLIGSIVAVSNFNTSAATTGADGSGKITWSTSLWNEHLAATSVKAGDKVTATITVNRPGELNSLFRYKFSDKLVQGGQIENSFSEGNLPVSGPNDTEITKNGGEFTYILEMTASKDYDRVYLHVVGGGYAGGGNVGDTVLTYTVKFEVTPAAKLPKSVTVTHKDIDTNQELDKETLSGLEGETVTTAAKTYANYDLADINVDGVSKGAALTYPVEYGLVNEVTYLYKKALTPVANQGTASAYYIDEAGNELQEKNLISGDHGTAFAFTAPEKINDSKLVEVRINDVPTGNTNLNYSGTFDKDNEQVVKFVYAKDKVVTIAPSTSNIPANKQAASISTSDSTQVDSMKIMLIGAIAVIGLFSVKHFANKNK